MKRKALGFQDDRAAEVCRKLFSCHAVIMKEPHGGEGRCTKHTHPGQQLRAEVGFQGEVQDNGNNNRQHAANALAKGKTKEYSFLVVADFFVDFDLQICFLLPICTFHILFRCCYTKEKTKEVWFLIKLIISLGVFVLSVVFKIAAKLRLTIPALYILAAGISTVFTDWASQHEKLILFGLYAQLVVVALSWVVTAVKAIRDRNQGYYEEDDIAWQIRRARELGVPLDSVRFDSSNNLIDPRTGMPVNFSAGG